MLVDMIHPKEAQVLITEPSLAHGRGALPSMSNKSDGARSHSIKDNSWDSQAGKDLRWLASVDWAGRASVGLIPLVVICFQRLLL